MSAMMANIDCTYKCLPCTEGLENFVGYAVTMMVIKTMILH